MAGETYNPPAPPVAGEILKAAWGIAVVESLVQLGKRRTIDLGGCEIDGHTGTSYARLRSGKIVELCEEDFRGLTVTCQFFVKVLNTSPVGTVRLRLRNFDDGANVAEMVGAVSDTDITQYNVACTLPAGTTAKRCRLEIVVSDADCPGFAYGQLEIEA